MARAIGIGAALWLLVWAAPVSAQLANTDVERKLQLGLVGGAGAVQKVGGLAGVTLGLPITTRLEIVGDGLWASNTASRRRIDLASGLAAYVRSTQIGETSGTLTAPAFYVGGGVRIPFARSGSWRPYALVTAGVARIALRPAITLTGADITSRLPQFGVTLGSDLTGEVTKPAVSAGFGVRSHRGRVYVDFGVRLINLQTAGQATRVIGATGALGFSL